MSWCDSGHRRGYGWSSHPCARVKIVRRVARDPPTPITGPLLANPQRVGKPLGEELAGIHSAPLARSWRVLSEIDDTDHTVIVLDIRHRSAAYRPR